MFVKKFEAPSLEEALRQVKTELGSQALIVSTLHRKGNWFNKGSVEVVAALDQNQKDKEMNGKPASYDEKALAEVFPHRRFGYASSGSLSGNKKIAANRYQDEEAEPVPAKRTAPVLRAKPSTANYEDLLSRLGFSTDSSKEIASRLVADYPRSDLQTPKLLNKALIRLISEKLLVSPFERLLEEHTWAFVGAPGSGKTSTVVKVALALRGMQRQTSFISADDRKIISKTELSGYARLLKIPCSNDLHEITTGRIQLIDTPAINPNESERSKHLSRLIDGRPVVLVLDASLRLRELLRMVDRAQAHAPKAIVFTRLDMVAERGVIYDVIRQTRLPLLGVSLSPSFKTKFQFFKQETLAEFILKMEATEAEGT